MKKRALLLAVALVAIWPLTLQAQVNSYFPEIWKEKPALHTVAATDNPYTILDYRLVRDFNISNRDKSDGYSHYKTIYKNIKINTQSAADSLTQLIMSAENNEDLRGLRLRLLHPNGEVTELNDQVRMVMLNDHRKAIIANNLQVEPGCELEYELNLKVLYNYSGSEYLQSGIPANKVSFTLVAPKNLDFSIKTTPGLPPVTDSAAGNNRYYQLNLHNVPALQNGDLFFYMPQLERVDFALNYAVEGKDTIRTGWQQFGENNYIPIVAVSKQEYKQLEKELARWPFLKRRMPETQLIYMVEQYIKTNFELTAPSETQETIDLISIIRSRRAEKAGFTRLMNAVYYMLNIPTQVLFTSARDTILPDSKLTYPQLPGHVLLYFPTVQQALAPTEMNTRFPCYPSLWAGIPALRCRDTLVNQESKVLTDFIRTPIAPYTLSSITMDATLKSVKDAAWEVKQSFGGYPASNIKNAFTTAGSTQEGKFQVYNAILPFLPGIRKPSAIKAENETFSNYMLDKPVTLTSTLLTPSLVEDKGTQINIHLGQLLGGVTPVNIPLPAGDLPVQITFPYYQEKRVTINIPAGYKVADKAVFSADISSKGPQPALGYKMRCEQDGSQLHIFIVEWYRQMDFTEENKEVFRQLLSKVGAIQQQDLELVKE